jgi:predicted  nucleic acid-binding Zn-ribbon protein
MSDGESIDVMLVIAQFREASDTLDALQERLKSLVATDVARREANESLHAAGTELQVTAAAVAALTEGLAEASRRTQEAMSKAQGLFESADLSSVKTSVVSTQSDIAGLRKQIEQLSKKTTDALAAATKDRVADKNDVLAAIKDLETQVRQENSKDRKELLAAQTKIAELEQKARQREAKIASVPEKYRSKFGL